MEQVTLGITAQSYSRVHVDNRVCDLDVGSGYPNGVTDIKVSFVQQLKSYVIWVQTRAIQVGFYLLYISPSTKGQEKWGLPFKSTIKSVNDIILTYRKHYPRTGFVRVVESSNCVKLKNL